MYSQQLFEEAGPSSAELEKCDKESVTVEDSCGAPQSCPTGYTETRKVGKPGLLQIQDMYPWASGAVETRSSDRRVGNAFSQHDLHGDWPEPHSSRGTVHTPKPNLVLAQLREKLGWGWARRRRTPKVVKPTGCKHALFTHTCTKCKGCLPIDQLKKREKKTCGLFRDPQCGRMVQLGGCSAKTKCELNQCTKIAFDPDEAKRLIKIALSGAGRARATSGAATVTAKDSVTEAKQANKYANDATKVTNFF